jgi:hypothetical protein
MRNALTVFALFLSGTGIFVSLAREELRCRVGLSSEVCSPAIAQPDNSFPSGQGTRLVNSPDGGAIDEKSTKIVNSPPETAKVLEPSEQTQENILPLGETATTEEKGEAEESSVPAANSPLGAPMEQKPAVDTAAISDPIPQKSFPSADPIAPPSAKNPAEDNLIPVIPAEGVAIPIAPAE